jgi:hypothetical protein
MEIIIAIVVICFVVWAVGAIEKPSSAMREYEAEYKRIKEAENTGEYAHDYIVRETRIYKEEAKKFLKYLLEQRSKKSSRGCRFKVTDDLVDTELKNAFKIKLKEIPDVCDPDLYLIMANEFKEEFLQIGGYLSQSEINMSYTSHIEFMKPNKKSRAFYNSLRNCEKYEYEEWMNDWESIGGKLEIEESDFDYEHLQIITANNIHIPALYGASSLNVLIPKEFNFTFEESHNELFYWDENGIPRTTSHRPKKFIGD